MSLKSHSIVSIAIGLIVAGGAAHILSARAQQRESLIIEAQITSTITGAAGGVAAGVGVGVGSGGAAAGVHVDGPGGVGISGSGSVGVSPPASTLPGGPQQGPPAQPQDTGDPETDAATLLDLRRSDLQAIIERLPRDRRKALIASCERRLGRPNPGPNITALCRFIYSL